MRTVCSTMQKIVDNANWVWERRAAEALHKDTISAGEISEFKSKIAGDFAKLSYTKLLEPNRFCAAQAAVIALTKGIADIELMASFVLAGVGNANTIPVFVTSVVSYESAMDLLTCSVLQMQ